jgi:hypothetical protein
MTDRQPNDPSTDEFREAAERSEAANIADESASYVNAIDRTDDASDKAKSTGQAEDEAADDA